MSTETTTAKQQTPAPVLLTLTLDTVTHYSYGDAYNEDGDRDEIPVTIGDQVIEAATAQIVKVIHQDVRKAVLAAVTEQIKAQVTDVIAETLTKPVRKTDMWGEPEGPATSLRSMIGAQVEAFMKRANPNSYSSRDDAVFEKLVRTEVHDAMTKELKETIAAARAKVEGAVKEKAAQLIADAVKVAGR